MIFFLPPILSLISVIDNIQISVILTLSLLASEHGHSCMQFLRETIC
uniref:Uncharacterized protein n=1 Tax=Rhizophora mucronata TaxID=61149 RepID=A0A2P2NNE9_RHIMU